MQYETWTINEICDGETVGVTKGASHDDALLVIRAAMYGSADVFGTPAADSVHELPPAA